MDSALVLVSHRSAAAHGPSCDPGWLPGMKQGYLVAPWGKREPLWWLFETQAFAKHDAPCQMILYKRLLREDARLNGEPSILWVSRGMTQLCVIPPHCSV